MAKGGARQGSGRKLKHGELGQTGQAKAVKLPPPITEAEFEAWVKAELIKKQNLDKKD